MALQLMGRKMLFLRRLALWMALAKTSLPVPVSPIKRTGTSLAATWMAISRAFTRVSLSPMMSSKVIIFRSRADCRTDSRILVKSEKTRMVPFCFPLIKTGLALMINSKPWRLTGPTSPLKSLSDNLL